MPLAHIGGFRPSDMKWIFEESERLNPELWKRCYPRIYTDYKGADYSSPKTVSRAVFSVAMKIEEGFMGDSEKYEIVWASTMAKYQVPVFWVTPDMVEAVMQTKPPMELDWYNMPLPFPATGFMLPRGCITHESEGPVDFVSYVRSRRYDGVPSVARLGPQEWASQNGSLTLYAHTDTHLTHWNIPHDYFPKVNLQELDEMIQRFDHEVHTSGWLTSPGMGPEDTRVGGKVAHLVFGLLLLMTRKPELVTKSQLVNRIARKGKATRELWSPGVIGKDYHIRRETVKAEGKGGTHASPRGHWVRGFYRDTLIGPGRSMKREDWIEPYWRGGGEVG